jgi:hypothetical protein
MLSRFPALCLLLAASATGQNPTAPKRGELDFELTSLGRDASGSTITAAVKATNKSTSSVVFLLLVGTVSAVDSSGGTYANAQVNGVAYCSRADRMDCVTKDSSWFVPLETYTEIGPGQSATFTLPLAAALLRFAAIFRLCLSIWPRRVVRRAVRPSGAGHGRGRR